jgi:predicted DNA binding CopG/RHH family protein
MKKDNVIIIRISDNDKKTIKQKAKKVKLSVSEFIRKTTLF